MPCAPSPRTSVGDGSDVLADVSLRARRAAPCDNPIMTATTEPEGVPDRLRTERVVAYRGYMIALKRWIAANASLFNMPALTLNHDLKSDHDKWVKPIWSAHDAAVTALTSVELVGSAAAVAMSRKVYGALYATCSGILGGTATDRTNFQRMALLRAADLAALFAVYRADLGSGSLDEDSGDTAGFAEYTAKRPPPNLA